MNVKTKRKVLFYRKFRNFTGGHLKIWNYFNHVHQSIDYCPSVFFSDNSILDKTNPWAENSDLIARTWSPESADVLFLGGMDWTALDDSFKLHPPVPIINLVQHVRHAEPDKPHFSYLKYPAIRICVSDQVCEAITDTGEVCGPVKVIPNGLDLMAFDSTYSIALKKLPRVLIVACKQPQLGRELATRLKNMGVPILLLTEKLQRDKYLQYVAESEIVVCLPNITEGFYLPALEAMAMRCLTICPDCVGNRGFQDNMVNCIKPEYTIDGLVASVSVAITLSSKAKEDMIDKAVLTSNQYSLTAERDSFLTILDNIDLMWAGLSK